MQNKGDNKSYPYFLNHWDIYANHIYIDKNIYLDIHQYSDTRIGERSNSLYNYVINVKSNLTTDVIDKNLYTISKINTCFNKISYPGFFAHLLLHEHKEGFYNIDMGCFLERLSKYEIDCKVSILNIELIAVAIYKGVEFNNEVFSYWLKKLNNNQHCQDTKNAFKNYVPKTSNKNVLEKEYRINVIQNTILEYFENKKENRIINIPTLMNILIPLLAKKGLKFTEKDSDDVSTKSCFLPSLLRDLLYDRKKGVFEKSWWNKQDSFIKRQIKLPKSKQK